MLTEMDWSGTEREEMGHGGRTTTLDGGGGVLTAGAMA